MQRRRRISKSYRRKQRAWELARSLPGDIRIASSVRYCAGSKSLSFLGLIRPIARNVSPKPLLSVLLHQHPMNRHVVRTKLNSTAALSTAVALTNDFHVITMHSCCFKPERVVVGNGQIALACYAELSVLGFVGFGIRRIIVGQKFTQFIVKGGFTSMHAREHGISRDYTLKVG